MDLTEVKHFEQQQVGKLKLSDAMRCDANWSEDQAAVPRQLQKRGKELRTWCCLRGGVWKAVGQ